MIQWFPGHMATTRDELRRAMPGVDLVLEILDARAPMSSENPLVASLRGEKPMVKLLNKADLADAATTAAWIERLSARPGVVAIEHHRGQRDLRGQVSRLVKKLARPVQGRPHLALILGVPNVGKSTIINTLVGRTVAKAANKPALTQAIQRYAVGRDLVLVDTPGLLWPKLEPEVCGYRLAVSGAISERVLNYQELCSFLAAHLRERAPGVDLRGYGLDGIPAEDHLLLEAVARSRGYSGRGGVLDLDRAAARFIQDYREGLLGRISLEAPVDWPV